MKSNITLILLGFLILESSCMPQKVDEKRMRKAKLENYVIDNQDKFEALFQFLEKNLHNLIDYRNSKSQSVIIGRDDTSVKFEGDDCHLVVGGRDKRKLPTEIQKELFMLLDAIDRKQFLAFDICRDSTIGITVKTDYLGIKDGWGWRQFHRLEYKPKRDLKRYYPEIIAYKDLSEKIIYFVYLYKS